MMVIRKITRPTPLPAGRIVTARSPRDIAKQRQLDREKREQDEIGWNPRTQIGKRPGGK